MTKIAAPFKYQSDYNREIQEFNINYNQKKNSLDKLLDFVEIYDGKRINISVNGEFPLGTLVSISKLHPNVYIRLTAQQLSEVPQLREKKCRYFFSADNCAYNYMSLEAMKDMGVTDVYIADDLLYDLKETRDYCTGNNIKMRLVLNDIPATTLNKGLTYKDPIFIPNDLSLLNNYFDMFEFNCGEPYDWHKFAVLYSVWFEKGYWYGDLQEINNDIKKPYPCMCVPKALSEFKSKCGRRCDKRKEAACHKCQLTLDTANAMAEKGIYLKDNKVKKMVKTE